MAPRLVGNYCALLLAKMHKLVANWLLGCNLAHFIPIVCY